MRFRKQSDINTKAYLLTTPSGNIIVLGAASWKKNNLITIKMHLFAVSRQIIRQDQYDSEVTSEETSWAL